MEAIETSPATARERLLYLVQALIDNIEDDKILEIYASVSNDDNVEYSDEIKSRIEKVRNDYTNKKMDNFFTETQFHQQLQQLRSRK